MISIDIWNMIITKEPHNGLPNSVILRDLSFVAGKILSAQSSGLVALGVNLAYSIACCAWLFRHSS